MKQISQCRTGSSPALFMSTSAAIADSLLRRAFGGQARRSLPRRTVGDWRPSFWRLSPSRSNGTGTTADGGASPLASACPSRTPTLALPHTMGEGWEGDRDEPS